MLTDLATALRAEEAMIADGATLDRVLDFWFGELGPADWFGAGERLDEVIGDRFGRVLAAARRGCCAPWRSTPRGRLAEILVLDQFSRHIHRGTPDAFAADGMALALAQEAVAGGHDLKLTVTERKFLYLPFEHSESLSVHVQTMALFTALGDAEALDWERRHLAVLERFGRYPHRNEVLGRISTPEEQVYLEEPGAGF
ncbi:DUF924 domain-containing protein [Tistrella mobilis]